MSRLMWIGTEMNFLLSDILGTDNDVICKNIEDEVDKALLVDAMKKTVCKGATDNAVTIRTR